MIIIAGHLLVEPAERDAYVAAHRDLVTRARAFDGCLHVAITADSVDPARIDNVEVWRDVDALDSWRGQADAPGRVRRRRRRTCPPHLATDGPSDPRPSHLGRLRR